MGRRAFIDHLKPLKGQLTIIQRKVGIIFILSVLCLVTQLCPSLCDPKDCSPPGYSAHGNSPGKITGVGCHVLLQGIFPTQGSNPGLPHCRQILYHLSHQGSRCLFLNNCLQPPVLTGAVKDCDYSLILSRTLIWFEVEKETSVFSSLGNTEQSHGKIPEWVESLTTYFKADALKKKKNKKKKKLTLFQGCFFGFLGLVWCTC